MKVNLQFQLTSLGSCNVPYLDKNIDFGLGNSSECFQDVGMYFNSNKEKIRLKHAAGKVNTVERKTFPVRSEQTLDTGCKTSKDGPFFLVTYRYIAGCHGNRIQRLQLEEIYVVDFFFLV